ncbi:MAG TPA: pilus assembly protein TadG-related protein [Gaiellaceae bacterium]
MLVRNARPIRRGSSERGAVIVMVAVWLPVLALFTSFAVDFAHFFDYSRNLQNRADAAALAAGDAYGGACFGSYTTTQTNAIGQSAQQYAGPPIQDPGNPYTVPTNLPFAYSTFSPAQYNNVPNLTKGTPPNYHLLLNSTQNWDAAGADWNMGSGAAKGSSLALCSSTDEDGKTGAMADVRITQSNLGLFFPLLGITPTISAHARVALEASAGSNLVIPIAVRDPGAIQCIAVNYVNAVTGTPINNSPIAMKEEGTDALTNNIVWDTPGGNSITMPAAGANAGVYVQVVTGPCGDNPSTYEPTGGLLYINSWSTATTPAAPVITSGGVFLSGSCASDKVSNQFFTNQACAEDLTANVLFPTGVTNKTVKATDTSTGTTYTLALGTGTCPAASTTCWSTGSAGAIQIDPVANPGEHQFQIVATSGTGNNKVTTNLGVQQQAFAACNEEVSTCPTNGDSGPIVLSQLTTTSAIGSFGPNAYAAGSAQSLFLTLEIAGLQNSPPGNPPTILRFSEPNKFASHATGLINCGQTSQGTSQAIAAIIGGCPVAGSTGTNGCPIGSNNFDYCAPLAINHRNSTCTPAGSQIPPATSPSFRTAASPTVPADCVGLVGGNKTPIAKAIACRIITNTTPTDCGSGNTKNPICSANNWSKTIGASSVPANDPRAITMVITAPEDLSGNNGPPVPIRNFATFYVTGWNTQGSAAACSGYGPVSPSAAGDALVINQCTDGTAPAGGCKTNGKGSNGGEPGEVWGYWMTYTDPNGIPTGTLCNPLAFGTCTPALTR